MPNIRESLYQCLENKVVASNTTPKLELFTVDPSCHAYAITVYIVYNNTSFLEINLNSGTIKNGNSEVGYFRIRQAALQSGEQHSLYLVPSAQNGNTYYLALTGVTQDSNIFIRKELKFGVYSKLLTSLTSVNLAAGNKLTDIKYDEYRYNTAYSNGYFVETEDNTYVRTLLPKGAATDVDRFLGAADNPFNGAYVSTITTKDILNADSNDKINIGTNADRIDTVYSGDVKTTNIDALKVDLGALEGGVRPITLGEDILLSGNNTSQTRYPLKSGFYANGRFEIRPIYDENNEIDPHYIHTRYEKVDGEFKQQIVVPGGLTISGTGNFTNATITNVLTLVSIASATAGVLNAMFIGNDGVVGSADLSLGSSDIINANAGHTAEDGGYLDFITALSQNSYGKVTYSHSVVSVRSGYVNTVDDSTHNRKPVNALAIKDALDTLDVSDITGFGVDQTLKTLSETDGKISATFQAITVKDAHVLVNEKMANSSFPYGDLAADDTEATIVEALAKRARVLHAHGYIDANGCMDPGNINNFSVETPGNGLNLMLADMTNSGKGKIKILKTGFVTGGNKFTFLNQIGGWQAVSTSTIGAATDDHIHGNISNDGKIADDTSIANAFKFILANANGELIKTDLAFDGSTTTKYLSPKGTWESIPTLSDLGGATSDHKHDDRYVRHDTDAQGLDATAQSNARKNIAAGTVNSVGLTSNNLTISITGDAVTESGTINVDLPVKMTVPNGSTYVSTSNATSGSLSYDSTSAGFKVTTPIVSVDAYGRVVGMDSYTQTVPGHTATYDLTDGVLTITVV